MNIIHKDIKSKNIIVKLQENKDIKKCYVADFGISILLQNQDHQVKGSDGTPNFRAPEVIKDLNYGLKADVWSYGVLLYVALFKRMPVHSEVKLKKVQELDIWREA